MESNLVVSAYETSPIYSLFESIIKLQDFPECDALIPALKDTLTKQLSAIPVKKGVRTYQKLVYHPSGVAIKDKNKNNAVVLAPYDLTPAQIKSVSDAAEREARKARPIDGLKDANPVYHLQFARMQKRRATMKYLVLTPGTQGFAFMPHDIAQAEKTLNATQLIEDHDTQKRALEQLYNFINTQMRGLDRLFRYQDRHNKQSTFTFLNADDLSDLSELYALKSYMFSSKTCEGSIRLMSNALSGILHKDGKRETIDLPLFEDEPNEPGNCYGYENRGAYNQKYNAWEIKQIKRMINYCQAIYAQLDQITDPDLRAALAYVNLIQE